MIGIESKTNSENRQAKIMNVKEQPLRSLCIGLVSYFVMIFIHIIINILLKRFEYVIDTEQRKRRVFAHGQEVTV